MMPVVHANGARIPAIGLGTGRLRGDVAVHAVHAALASGYRHIDTAAKYGNEVEVGEAIRGQPISRDAIFVTTKVMPDDRGDTGIEIAVESSLRRLQMDDVDLLLIHWPDQRTPIAPPVRALCNVRRRGLARNIGVSNFPVRYVDAAVHAATEPIAVNQVERHAYFDQKALAGACARHGIAIMAFCPLGRGALLEEPVVREIAVAHGKSPAQILLRWQLEKPMNVVVPSSSDPERIAQNLDILDFELTAEETGRLSRLSRADGRIVRGPPGFDWDGEPL